MIPYFSHDIFSRENLKIKRLLAKHKMEGYGIFWAIAEFLHNHENKISVDELDLLAMDIGAKKEKIESIIFDFGLFSVRKNVISSKRVAQNLKLQKEKSKKAREAASVRWQDKEAHADALPMHSERNAIKEKKEKEIKEKEKKIKKENDKGKKADETQKPVEKTSPPEGFSAYGGLNNVFLSDSSHSFLLSEAKGETLLNTVISELSANIALKKEKPFDGECPEMHFVRLQRYLKQKLSTSRTSEALQNGGKALEHLRKIKEEGGVPPPPEFFASKEKLMKKLRGEQEI